MIYILEAIYESKDSKAIAYPDFMVYVHPHAEDYKQWFIILPDTLPYMPQYNLVGKRRL